MAGLCCWANDPREVGLWLLLVSQELDDNTGLENFSL